jgi:hypothetical protein
MSLDTKDPRVGAFEIVLTKSVSNLLGVSCALDANRLGAKYPHKPVVGNAGIVNRESQTMEGTRFNEGHVRMLTTRHRTR